MKARITVLITLCAMAFLSTFANFSMRPPGVRMPQAWATSTPHPYINAASTSLSPVAIPTSSPTVLLYGRPRCGYCFDWTGSGNLWCAPIPATGNPSGTPATAADFVPANGTGLEFAAIHAPWCSGGSLVSDPSVGWECVSDSGTLNVSTIEFQHCYAQRMGQP
jgi:hypothetical protein